MSDLVVTAYRSADLVVDPVLSAPQIIATFIPAGVSIGGSSAGIIYGSGAPGNGAGADGNTYIDTTNNRLYGPKASGVWPSTYFSFSAALSVILREDGFEMLREDGSAIIREDA